MKEENDNPRVYRCISNQVQKVVYFLLSVTPQLLFKLFRPVAGTFRAIWGVVRSAARYSAQFFGSKLDSDREFREKLQKISENEQLRNTGDRIRSADLFKRIAAFLSVLGRSVAEGTRLGVAEYYESSATKSCDSARENKSESAAAPPRERLAQGTERSRHFSRHFDNVSIRERLIRTEWSATRPESNSISEQSRSNKVPSTKRSKRNFIVTFGALAIVIIGVYMIVSKKDAGDVMTVEIAGIETRFHWCPPGEFMMGSPTSEEGRFDHETQHKVKLTKGFWLCEVPVTVEAFQKFVDDTGYKTEGERNNGEYTWRKTDIGQTSSHPVIWVSWNDAQAYIEWLNKNYAPKGLTFKLPSEAHWEYACRAGSKTAYWWGNSIEEGKGKINLADADFKEMLEEKEPGTLKKFEERGWTIVSFHDGYAFTNPVDALASNDWGLKDMHGNVFEWCQDWYDDYPTGQVTDPTGPESGSYRVSRGGCWYYNARYCRSAYRGWFLPGDRYNYLGFRLELDDSSSN